MKIKAVALILAGGSGKRMKGYETLKPFLPLGDKTIIETTLTVFAESNISNIYITLPHTLIEQYRLELAKYSFEKDFIKIITGGATRQESSFLALKAVKDNNGADIVVIHDAVRPFISKDLINESIVKARNCKAIEVSVPATSTIVETDGKYIKSIPDRRNLYYTQTPQTFDFELIYNAHKKAIKDNLLTATDDAQVALHAGHKIEILTGSYDNIKITTPKDYELAKIIAKNKIN